MSSERIPVRKAAEASLKDPEFRAEYEALEDEFALASALIEARSESGSRSSRVTAPPGQLVALAICSADT